MPSFTKKSHLSASPEVVFGYHEQPGAFQRLTPPWEPVEMTERTGTIRDGDRATLCIKQGPISLKWVAEHRDYIPNEQFKDVALSGPFPKWEHTHRVTPGEDGGSILTDSIDYRLPGGPVGRALGGGFVQRKLARMFTYRHRVTADDTAMMTHYPVEKPLRVLISGATGLVGSALAALLSAAGHTPVALRRAGQGPGGTPWESVEWNPHTGAVINGNLDGLDAVVHLAGAGIADKRWTEARKRLIKDSRVIGTHNLCSALSSLPNPPRVMVSASATGYYGDADDAILDESSPMGVGFRAEVCRDWEAATRPAEEAGIRVVHLRAGIVLSLAGGALAKMALPFRCGLGGTFGNGRQYMSWIALDDALGMVYHALMTDSVAGAVNAVSPVPCTNSEFTRTLGRVLHRPAGLAVPRTALRLALGEMADEALLSSARVQPAAMMDAGYVFRFTRLDDALQHALGRVPLTANAG